MCELSYARLRSSVDAALVDVPCSSSGVLRRRPSLRWGMMNPNIIESDEEPEAKGGERRGEIVIEDVEKAPPPATTGSLPSLQRALLLRAASAVKPGGRLVYATCSVTIVYACVQSGIDLFFVSFI